MKYHQISRKLSRDNADRMRYEAEDHEHFAVQHGLSGFLCHVRGIALHNQALSLEQNVEGEELALKQEEEVAKEYKELFDNAEQAIRECEARIRDDEEASQGAHDQAKTFLDEMYNIEYQFAQVCAEYKVSEVMCETVARFKGVEQQEKGLALNAIYEEELAYGNEKKEEQEEELKLLLEKNATYYGEMEHEAEVNATRLENEYDRDEKREESMEGSSAALLNRSDEERELARQEDGKAKQAQTEAIDLARTARFHARKFRWYAMFAVVTTVAVLWVFVDYLLLLLSKRRHDTQNKSLVTQDDTATVAFSEMSEESPLIDHENYLVELRSSNDSTYDPSYVTVDLTSQNDAGSTSSLSSTSGSVSRFFQAVERRIQQLLPSIMRRAPTIELAVVVAAVFCAACLLLIEIIPDYRRL
jgi:hypothetical protein